MCELPARQCCKRHTLQQHLLARTCWRLGQRRVVRVVMAPKRPRPRRQGSRSFAAAALTEDGDFEADEAPSADAAVCERQVAPPSSPRSVDRSVCTCAACLKTSQGRFVAHPAQHHPSPPDHTPPSPTRPLTQPQHVRPPPRPPHFPQPTPLPPTPTQHRHHTTPSHLPAHPSSPQVPFLPHPAPAPPRPRAATPHAADPPTRHGFGAPKREQADGREDPVP